jgi:hypothetical protein
MFGVSRTLHESISTTSATANDTKKHIEKANMDKNNNLLLFIINISRISNQKYFLI